MIFYIGNPQNNEDKEIWVNNYLNNHKKSFYLTDAYVICILIFSLSSLFRDFALLLHIMKPSKYNYIIKYQNNDYIFFNGIKKKFIIVPFKLKNLVENFINKQENIDNDYQSFYNKLIDSGLIINDDIDELKLIQDEQQKINNQKKYVLTILPTYKCNFSCWYCIQNHKDEYMNLDIINRIKLHIKNYLILHNIKEFSIQWFGGEPMLCFDTICDISKYAIDFCNKNDITFQNHITTNGYLITEENSKEMGNIKFRSYQITIDGDKENHNKIRNENSNPSFNKILENLLIILKTQPLAIVTLRFNYTESNIIPERILSDVNNIIPFEFRKRIFVLPRKVWQVDKTTIDQELKRNLFKSFRNSGYNINVDCDICFDYFPCPDEKKHHHTIFHNGSVSKCTNTNPEQCLAYLDEFGNICNLRDVNDIFSCIKNSKCRDCKYLPICMGPCLKSRNEKTKCVLKIVDSTFEESIMNYCEFMINNT